MYLRASGLARRHATRTGALHLLWTDADFGAKLSKKVQLWMGVKAGLASFVSAITAYSWNPHHN